MKQFGRVRGRGVWVYKSMTSYGTGKTNLTGDKGSRRGSRDTPWNFSSKESVEDIEGE